ncbi:hypothetical protein BKA93DRAFT_216652 [Sparassis latifolia]
MRSFPVPWNLFSLSFLLRIRADLVGFESLVQYPSFSPSNFTLKRDVSMDIVCLSSLMCHCRHLFRPYSDTFLSKLPLFSGTIWSASVLLSGTGFYCFPRISATVSFVCRSGRVLPLNDSFVRCILCDSMV